MSGIWARDSAHATISLESATPGNPVSKGIENVFLTAKTKGD
jgi:hypothetical protein